MTSYTRQSLMLLWALRIYVHVRNPIFFHNKIISHNIHMRIIWKNDPTVFVLRRHKKQDCRGFNIQSSTDKNYDELETDLLPAITLEFTRVSGGSIHISLILIVQWCVAGTRLNRAVSASCFCSCRPFDLSVRPPSRRCSSKRPSATCPSPGSSLTCTNPVTYDLAGQPACLEKKKRLGHGGGRRMWEPIKTQPAGRS